MIIWVQDNSTSIWHVSVFNYPFSADTLCGLERINTFISTYGSPLLKYPEASICSKCKTLELLRKLGDMI